MAITDVVGSSPISYPTAAGGQQFLPLSALQFDGSTIELKSDWSSQIDATAVSTILELAKARVASLEIVQPRVPPPAPALVFTAKHPGVESNGIEAGVAVDPGSPLSATIAISATENDIFGHLANASGAAHAVGVNTPTGNPGDPVAGTGLAVVKVDSVAAGNELPVAASGPLTSAGFDVKDGSANVLFTLLPRPDFPDNGALSLDVSLDTSGTSYTITVTYDSSRVAGQQKVTLQTLSALADPVAYLVSVAAPPGGAELPKSGTVPLAGGGPGTAASGVAYTS